jgi:hypothetical protein
MYQVVFKPQSYGDSSYPYDFTLDNIDFTNAAAPAPAAAQGASVIDTFQNGLNQTESNWLGAGATAGFLSDDDDATSAALCPTYTSGAPSQPGFCLDIASGAGLPTVVTGIPGFEAHMTDSNIDWGAASGYAGYCGMGFYFNNGDSTTPGNTGVDISQGGAFSKLIFYAKSNNGTPVYVEMNDSTTYQDNCYGASNTLYSIPAVAAAWTMYTIDFKPSDPGYNLGTVNITGGTNGCKTPPTAGAVAGSGAPGGVTWQFAYTNAEQIQWEPQGGAPAAIDLAVADIYLAP